MGLSYIPLYPRCRFTGCTPGGYGLRGFLLSTKRGRRIMCLMQSTESPDPAGQDARDIEPQFLRPPSARQRAAMYVDGFNLYHALNDLGQPHLKWLNLQAVARLLVAGRPEDVVRIVFCTAVPTQSVEKQNRHRLYVRALEGTGVTVFKGHFSEEPRHCRKCGHQWQHPTEKEGDTSLAITVIDDAHRDRFDVAYLVSADGDHAPVARMIRDGFPSKRLVTVAPPNRQHNFKIRDAAHSKSAITADLVEKCLFGRAVPDENGNMVIRPPAYDPPPGWVAPQDRPKKGG